MTQSMTGFARGSVTTEAVTVTVECRSVNNRYLDVSFRMPETLRALEGPLREKIGQHCSRGKIEVSIRVAESQANTAGVINVDRLQALHTALKEIESAFPSAVAPDQLALLLAPGVMAEQEINSEALGTATLDAAKQCMEELQQQRLQEGEKLAHMVRERANTMREHLLTLRAQLPELNSAHRQRLLDRLQSLDIEADPVRLEEEIVYILQRADVEEEMDRLGAHLEAIESALDGDAPCGRRLDFLMQELNREANTLGSKSTALSTTNISVDFKVLIEQMREQIQNIE